MSYESDKLFYNDDSNYINSLKKARLSTGMKPDDISYYSVFNRFRLPEADPFTSNIGYVFFTKPSLNIDIYKNVYNNSKSNLEMSSYLQGLNNTDFGQYILASLSNTSSYSHASKDSGNFIKILSNSVMNFEPKDNSLKTEELYHNFIGYKFNMPYTFIDSITADSITFNFLEYNDLRVTHLIKVWVEYINNLKRGMFVPLPELMRQKVLDYACSIYFFLCGPDGHTIKYFTKLTGCYPSNIPYSSFSWELGSSPDIKKLSVTFQYQIKEDLSPDIIYEFNKITGSSIGDGTETEDDLMNNWKKNVYINDNGLFFK